jgi:transcriptional regulator with XRE-family HTH domain
MLSRSQIISKLLTERSSRESYIRTKLNQLIPSQIKALRLCEEWTQEELGVEADMKQARISAMEKPGEVAFTLETLIRLASAFRVGLQVRFVPYTEMLKWDDGFSQDSFAVTPIEEDKEFLNPSAHTPVALSFLYTPPVAVPMPVTQQVEAPIQRNLA